MKRRSMTGYGKAMRETPFARWLFEISSVNRKGLDITVNLPPFLIFLDPVIRQWVAKSVERGTVTVRIGCELKGVKHVEAHLKAEKKRWEKIGKSVNASPADITLPFLLMQTSAQQVPLDQEKVVYKEAKELWDKSAAAWLLMKEEEGRTLAKEVKVRVKLVQKEVKEIEQFLPQLMEHYLDKIMDRLKQFKLDPEKLKAEAILQASRSDVTEEIVRLKSHLEQMVKYLAAREISIGRTLDFLAQEMGREVSTLSAKIAMPFIHQVLRLKSEIEKIREQVQNVE